MLAFMIAGARFRGERPAPGPGARTLALAALLGQWAIVGLFVLPVVRGVLGA
jgi:hypothetical protein